VNGQRFSPYRREDFISLKICILKYRIRYEKNLLAYILLSVTLIGCNDDPEPALVPEAEDFLNEVLDIMEENSINRNAIDWPDFKASVFEKATGAKTIAGIQK
jgi:hypothetical protein